MITINIKTLKGDLFQILCKEGSNLDDILHKIKEYDQEYNNDFLRFFDISTEKEIKYDDILENYQHIFVFVSTDVFVNTSIYPHYEDEYGIEILWRPFHLKSLRYLKKVDMLYFPSSKTFIYDKDKDGEEISYKSLEELIEKECLYPEIQKKNITQKVMEKWNNCFSEKEECDEYDEYE